MRFFNKVKGTLDVATRKSQDALEISKLNSQIKKLEADADKLYQSIGQKVYEDPGVQKQETSDHIRAQSDALQHLHHQIQHLKMKCLFLKDQIECESCRKILPFITKFCPDCGNNITDQGKRTSKMLALEDNQQKE